MRICLTVDFVNLPKFLSAEVVGLVLSTSLKKSADELVGASRKAKATVKLDEAVQPEEVALAIPGKKRGRKPKEIVTAAAQFPVADQPDPSDGTSA